MTPDQAVAVMEHLAERGVLGPLQGTTYGGRWASSRLMHQNMVAQIRDFDIDFTKLTARLRSIQARYESQQPVPLA